MEYLLVMSLSGSVMTVICLVLRRLLKGKVSTRLFYLLEKVAVLYYLIPLPFLKGWYREALRHIIPQRPMEIEQISLAWTNYVIHTNGKKYFNAYAVIQVVAAAVWLIVICFLAARMLMDYARTSRVIAGCADRTVTDRQKEFLAGIKEQYGVRQNVILSCGYTGVDTMTFGVCRPVIICDREVGSREAELLVCHEMVHIKRRDIIWKIFMQFAVILHWWNPIIRILQHDFESVCECSCDEMVMQGKTQEEMREYRVLLTKEALTQRATEKASLKWKTRFGEKQTGIKERIDNLMKRKRWNRFAAVALVVALTFANSMTVFAYRDTLHEDTQEEISQEEIDRMLQCDTLIFTPDSASEEERQKYELLKRPEIRYDMQFTDEEGNIYPIAEEETAEAYRVYSHTYDSGTAAKHNKNPDGHCEMSEYRAQRCSKCGYVVWGEQIGWFKYDVCPH